jgi:hypothetical protein
MAVAASAGAPVAPLVLRSTRRPQPATPTTLVEVVGNQHVGNVAAGLGDIAEAVCASLGLEWAVLAFDRRRRLTAVTTRSRPSAAATARLAELLGAPRAA